MKWNVVLCGVTTLPVLLISFECGGKSDLSRNQAKKVIVKSEKFTPADCKLKLEEPELQGGVREGLWSKTANVYNRPDCSYFALTSEGKVYFRGDNLGSVGCSINVVPYVEFAKPLARRVVEVTGITDGPGRLGPPGTVKVVEFTWKWEWGELSDQLKSVVGGEWKEAQAEALLRLYDDGWRVERVAIKMNPTRAPASASSLVGENQRATAQLTNPAANQASAVGSLRTVNTACIIYGSTYNVGYPKAISDLGPQPAGSSPTPTLAGLIDKQLAGGTRNGYTFIYRAGPPVAPAREIWTYTVVARPTVYGRTGMRNYFTDETGVIRVTTQDREATANDPPLGG